jgi:hypothetical protein
VLLAHKWILGPFDFTATNKRYLYIERESIACAIALALQIGAHAFIKRSLSALIRDLSALVWLALAAEAAHVAAYGWPLEVPLPGAKLFFMPFIASIFVVLTAIAGALLTAVGGVRRRR